jgi:hypothetical protein
MSARATDPIIAEARERMRAAVVHAQAAAAELLAAKRDLARHPDIRGKGMTLARWYLMGLDSVLDDAPLGDAAGWIQDDLRGQRRTMEAWVRDEAKDLARFGRGKQRAAA